MIRPLSALLILHLVHSATASAQTPAQRWWPVQKAPRGVVRIAEDEKGPERILVQSLSGLAAQAVNEGRLDEMVWVDFDNVSYREWYGRMIRDRGYEDRGTAGAWDLVKRHRDLGVVKGYVLYRYDTSEGPVTQLRPGMDHSVNVATTVAGLCGGVLVSEGLEEQAKAAGLTRLIDVRDKTTEWCLERCKGELNNRHCLLQDPQVPHCRDFAIANRVMTLYGHGKTTRAVLEWMEPLSAVVGWNAPSEWRATLDSSLYGHIQTASNWCMNLPVLMAGAHEKTPAPLPPFDPATIDWDDTRPVHAFILTDGDNVQWFMGNFFHNASYWANPHREAFPFGWSCCMTQMAQVCPQAADYARETISPNCGMVEWGGGYYYPDRFAELRPDRERLLRAHFRRVWANMQATGVRTVGFIVQDADGEESLKAHQWAAEEMEGIAGMVAIQFAPYHGGEGKVFWVKDRNGVEVPVVCAHYSMWADLKQDGFGTPAEIADLLNASIGEDGKRAPRHDLSIVHAWSQFLEPGTDASGTKAGGLTPVKWCVDRLDDSLHVVTPEELMWRIRMEHNPEQTQAVMETAGADSTR